MKPTKPADAPAATSAAQNITMVSLDHLLAHKDLKNRPIDTSHVEDLYNSIKAKGLDTALVTWDGGSSDSRMKIGDDTYPSNFLVAGFHRRDALRRLRKDSKDRFDELFPGGLVPVNRRTGSMAEMLCLQLRENVARKDPTPQELFPLLEKLSKDHKMKNIAIAKSIGKSEAWVSRMLSITTELGDEGAAAVADGEATVSDLQAVAEESKRSKKTGKDFDKQAALSKVKAKGAAKKASGAQRGDKRASAKTLWGRYLALPKGAALGVKFRVAEAALKYLAGETDKLEPEIQRDPEAKKAAVAAK